MGKSVQITDLVVGDCFYLFKECTGDCLELRYIQKDKKRVICYKGSNTKPFRYSFDEYVYIDR